MKWPFFHCADCPDKFVTSKLPWKKLHPGSIWSWQGCICMMKSKQEKPQSNLPPPRTYVWNMWLVIMNPILTVFLINQQQNSCSSTCVMPSLKLTAFPSWMLLSRELNLPLMGASWLLWTAAGPRCRRVHPFTATPHTALVCEKHVHRPLTELADTWRTTSSSLRPSTHLSWYYVNTV